MIDQANDKTENIPPIGTTSKHDGGRADTLQRLLIDDRQGKNNTSNEQLKATSTGDMDGNEAPPPTTTMDP